MIDEIRLEELRTTMLGHSGQQFVPMAHEALREIADTLDALWKVARAARRWQKAPPGRQSSEREAELVELLKALPPEG
jgi:hypothetical protein